MQDQERLSIFATLSFAVDYEAKHRNLRGSRHEGTGTWLIEHPAYIAWKASTSSEGFLLHGIRRSLRCFTFYYRADNLMVKLDPERASSRKLVTANMSSIC